MALTGVLLLIMLVGGLAVIGVVVALAVAGRSERGGDGGS